jgi:hypothetical protein
LGNGRNRKNGTKKGGKMGKKVGMEQKEKNGKQARSR